MFGPEVWKLLPVFFLGVGWCFIMTPWTPVTQYFSLVGISGYWRSIPGYGAFMGRIDVDQMDLIKWPKRGKKHEDLTFNLHLVVFSGRFLCVFCFLLCFFFGTSLIVPHISYMDGGAVGTSKISERNTHHFGKSDEETTWPKCFTFLFEIVQHWMNHQSCHLAVCVVLPQTPVIFKDLKVDEARKP